MKKIFPANFIWLKCLSFRSISIPILISCQTIVIASLQSLKLIFPMPEGKLGGSPR